MRRIVLHRLVLAAAGSAIALSAVGLAACGFDGVGTGAGADFGVDAAASDGVGGEAAELDAAGDTNIGVGDAPADTVTPVVHAGHALRFGAGSYVDIGALAIPADFTFEAWVRPAMATGETYVMAKDRSGQGQGQCRFGLDGSRRLFFMLTDSASDDHGLYNGDYVLLAPSALALDTWAHVAVTKSGAAFALFIDGASVDSFTAASPFIHAGPAVSFRIGGRVAGDGTSVAGGFAGAIDEVRVWNVRRTPAQIAASMREPITTASPGFAALVGSWRFNEGAGATTADGSGSHPGTLVAAPLWITSAAY